MLIAESKRSQAKPQDFLPLKAKRRSGGIGRKETKDIGDLIRSGPLDSSPRPLRLAFLLESESVKAIFTFRKRGEGGDQSVARVSTMLLPAGMNQKSLAKGLGFLAAASK